MRPERDLEADLKKNQPATCDPYAWAQFNQWASEQRTRNQKETKT